MPRIRFRNLVAAAVAPDVMHWSGVATIEGEQTGDGRLLMPGSLEWEVPFPLTWQPDGGSHDGASVVGIVFSLERAADGRILAEGTFDLDTEVGREAARQVARGFTDGVSIEPDTVTVETWVIQDVIDEMEAWLDDELPVEGDDEPETESPDGQPRELLDRYSHDDWLEVVTSARIRTLAMVTTPAFDRATIALADGVTYDALIAGDFPAVADDAPPADVVEEAEPEETLSIVASAATLPSSWFDAPELDGPTPITVDDDGRLYGHAALWDTCHIGFDGVCVTPPRSAAGYAYFRTGEVACSTCDDDRARIPVGTVTMDTGHAPLTLQAGAAAAHYDNTGTGVADVAVGEDAYGVWVAGAVRPEILADDGAMRRLRASALSGDWRRIGGSMELVGLLAVNVPGFPVPRSVVASAAATLRRSPEFRPRARMEHDEPVALVAAGLVVPTLPDREVAGAGVEELARVSRWVARQEAREAAAARARIAPLRTRAAGRLRDRIRG